MSSLNEILSDKTIGIRHKTGEYYLHDGTKGRIANDELESIMYHERRLIGLSLVSVRNLVTYIHGDKQGNKLIEYTVENPKAYAYLTRLLS